MVTCTTFFTKLHVCEDNITKFLVTRTVCTTYYVNIYTTTLTPEIYFIIISESL